MKMKDTITPAVLSAATGLLQPYCPDLSPRSLVAAIKAYKVGSADSAVAFEQPLTRKAVAALLGISLQSVSRYMNDGRLRRIRLSPSSVRIDPASVRALLAGNASADDVESEG